MKKRITFQAVFFILFCSFALSAYIQFNNEHDCLNEKYYSRAFLSSPFYQGWQQLNSMNTRQCKQAMPYFSKSLKNNLLIELSTLYYQYCAFPEQNNVIERSNIYQGSKQTHKIEEDEFKWIINMALCNSAVEQFAIGKMLYDGFIIERNVAQGIHYLQLAAKQDHILAQRILADILEKQGKKALAQKWRKKTKALLARYR